MMKRKFVFLFIILITFSILISISNMSIGFTNLSSFSSEVRSMPSGGGSSSTVTPPDPGPKPEIPPSSTTTSSKKTETFLTSISGNVFEDLKNMESSIAKSTGMAVADGEKNGNEKGIEKVYVELLDSNGNVVDHTYTNSNGDYNFSPAAGTYRVRFNYGRFLEDGTTDVGTIKNVLKYNGQDYYSVSVGGSGTIENSYIREIMTSGKACTQIMLAIDISSSMSDTLSNGETRLQVQLNSAKQLVNSLLEDETDNIYIGIVAFANKGIVWQNLTKNKDRLIEKLDSLNATFSGATNIYDALNCAETAFVNNTPDSNRLVFLLSDGVPLSDGSTEIFVEDLENEDIVRQKLVSITSNTKSKMESLISEGINLVTLITKTYDDEIDQFVSDMCNVENIQFFHSDDENVTNVIKSYVKDIILSGIKENTTEFSTYLSYFKGFDDENRRNEVNNNFSEITPEIAQLFKILDYYDGTEPSISLAKDFSEKTYMTATTGEYHIDNYPSVSETDDTITVNGVTYNKDEYSYSISGYYGQNLGISLRDTFTFDTDIKISAMRLSLSDGQNIFFDVDEQAAFVDKDIGVGETRTFRDVKDIPVYYFDTEITQGSTLEIEYTISVKNISLISSSDISLITYIPENLNFNIDSHLLTLPDYTNEMLGWDVIQYNMPNSSSNSQLCAKINLGNNAFIRNSCIGNNGERYIKVVYSRYLSSVTTDSNFSIGAEIYSYSNPLGRRMQSSTSTSTIRGQEVKFASMFTANAAEIDYAQSSELIIIPPTGKSDFSKYAIILVILLLLTCSVIINNKNKK